MMETYPELVKYVENVNGQLKITDWEPVLDIYRNRTNSAYNASLNANLVAKNAENRADRTEFLRTRGDYYRAGAWISNTAGWMGNGLATGATGGAVIGSAAGGVGAVPGAIVGGIGGLVAGTIAGVVDSAIENANAGENMNAALDQLAELYEQDQTIFIDKNFTAAIENLDGASTELKNVLIANKNEVQRLIEVEKQAADYQEMIS